MGTKSSFDYQKDIHNIDNQIAQLTELRKRTIDIYNRSTNTNQISEDSIWSKIDKEIIDCDKLTLESISKDKNYINVNNQLNSIVQQELLLLVKQNVESREDGKALLEKQLEIVKSIKSKSKENREEEILLFSKFKEYSKLHPNTTYEEFLKAK